MDISVNRRAAKATVLELSGRLTMAAAIDLRDAVGALVSVGEVSVVIDLGGVDFIDASGLGGLIGAQRTVREAGGDLRIAAPSAEVRAVLETTSLDRVLAPFKDSKSASASLAA